MVTAHAGEEALASRQLRRLAADDPTRPFVDDGPWSLTYSALDERADRVAAELLDDGGVAPVAVCCRGLAALSAATLGASRAGRIIAVQDPSLPPARRVAILEDVGAELLLSDLGDPGGPEARWRTIDPLRLPARAPASPAAQPDIASIVHTSGSTGPPKGVIISAAARDALGEGLALFGDVNGIRVPYVAGNAWTDAMVHAAAIVGATLVPYDVGASGTAPLPRWLIDQRIGALAVVPTLLRRILDHLAPGDVLANLRIVVSTGEALQWSDVVELRSHLGPDAMIFNMFGTTESGTIAANVITADTPSGTGAVAPGVPLPSVEVEVIDGDGAAVGVGVAGEIVVTSPTVMLGFWRRPEETARVLEDLNGGRRRFRTGDGGRLLADGTLEHLGRLDHVVKIAGHRVELGEVEAGLAALPEVRAAVATTYEDAAGDLRLLATVTAVAGRRIEADTVRAELARSLPRWALPDRVQVRDELPRLPGGKVDRHHPALRPAPAPARPAPEGGEGLLGSLIELWSQALSYPDVHADTDFFAAGGDSLRAAQLFADLGDQLGHDRPLTLLLEHPTPRLLAAALQPGASGATELLTFNPTGTTAPLIVVHDGTGSVVFARRLADLLGDDQPVLAVRGVALDGGPPAAPTVEGLATHYLTLVEGVMPAPAYQLYGPSFGGLIAFEMALQLQAAGTEVALLCAGDTSWPVQAGDAGGRARRLRAAVAGGQLGAVPGIVGGHVRWRVEMARAERAWRQDKAATDAGRLAPVTGRNEHALLQYGAIGLGYRPSALFDGPVLLLRSADPEDRPDRGWSRHVTGQVVCSDVRCGHPDLSRDAGAAEVAAALAGSR